MYNKILVPLDGSGLAECVFEHVKEIAKGCEAADVDLVYVIPQYHAYFNEFSETTDPRLGDLGVRQYGTIRDEKWAKEYLDNVAKSFTKDGIPSRTTVLRGNPADAILNYARDNAVDLVVMATHGSSGPAKYTLGSTADRVLRQALAPVLIVRPDECRVAA